MKYLILFLKSQRHGDQNFNLKTS